MPDLAPTIFRAAIAVLCAALICLYARRRRLLDQNGSVAALIIGTAIVAFGGWWAGILLVAFFLTSSLLSPSGDNRPARTWRQVVANGGPASVLAALSLTFDSPPLLVASAATIAAATADTWATEIGRRSGAVPRSVTTLRPVPIGTSGAISAPGTIASLIGAAFIALLAVLIAPLTPLSLPPSQTTLIAISLAGAAGSLVDTLLGASVQARYRCRTCGLRAENSSAHDPDHITVLESGVPWITNDIVNLGATSVAGVASIIALATTA